MKEFFFGTLVLFEMTVLAWVGLDIVTLTIWPPKPYKIGDKE